MIDTNDIRRSQKLLQIIREEITRAPLQRISFERFMELALFTPSVGYYQANANLIGKQGDFTTAPEISTQFSRCLATYCEPILKTLNPNTSVVMEMGPGTGRLAADLLLSLEQLGCLPSRYILVEVSEALQMRQKQNLRQWVPHLVDRIEYRRTLPSQPVEGVIVANEVIDALPVSRFELLQGRLYEHFVGYADEQFVLQRGKPSTLLLEKQLKQIQKEYLSDIEHYVSEVRPTVDSWLRALQATISKGCILLIDYGKSAREYYHPDRTQGTLRCYYQHACYSDPLQRVGLQDITSDVDFTQIATIAVQSNWEVIAFTTQAVFLLATGFLKHSELCYDKSTYLAAKGRMNQLMAPLEMGTACKVMVLGHRLQCNLLPLEEYDLRMSL